MTRESERVLHEWEFAGYVVRIVETEPGIVHFEQAQGPPIGHERIGPLKFNRTEKPLGDANEIIHLSLALAEQEARHKRARSALESLKKHLELTAPAAVTYSTTYQLVLAALAALEEKP